MLEIDLKPNLLALMLALLVSGCDAPDKAASAPAQTVAEQDADFNRMATAGKMLSDLQTYLASDDSASRAFTFDRLTFDPGSSRIRPVDQPTVQTLATTLRNNPAVRARIVGFGDGERSGSNNNALGLQRARAVLLALGNAGVDPSRLEAAAGRETNRQRPAQLVILQK